MTLRACVALLTVATALLGGAGEASAHPLGNFSVNHLTEVRVSSERVELLYVLDQAEIPTFQERSLSRPEVLERKRSAALRGLELNVDGRDVPLRPAGAARLTFPAGDGGLETTRLELPLEARVERPDRVALRDRTFAGRAGWKAIVAQPGDGTAVRSSAPAEDPTDRLRGYPEAGLESPLDQRSASFSVAPGPGTLTAPEVPGGAKRTSDRGGDGGFEDTFSDAASGEGVLLVLLLAALGWGALHALSPGHGKAMVAAYLIGTRGTARHAVALGGIVTFTHTVGVFALGVVTLALSQFLVPEDLYPWLNLVAGLMVLIVGAAVLRSRFRHARADGTQHHSHHHAHGHTHHHHVPDDVTPRGLLAMGAAAGLIPCPSALVVLLGAIAQHEVALGLLLIVAFSAGLAATLTALGLAVVHGRRLLAMARISDRLATRGRLSGLGRLVTALPAVSALLIVGVGFALTAQAIPDIA